MQTKERKHLPPNSRKYREFLSGFENYRRGENSNRGIDNEIRNLIPQYSTIDKFLTKYRSKPWSNLNYKSLTIVVLGHGIEADKVYLRTLLDRCESLNKIVMFRYDSETEESYQNKCSFFVPYCSNIEQIYY